MSSCKGCQSLTNSGNIDPDASSLGGKNDIHPGQSIPAEEGSLNNKRTQH